MALLVGRDDIAAFTGSTYYGWDSGIYNTIGYTAASDGSATVLNVGISSFDTNTVIRYSIYEQVGGVGDKNLIATVDVPSSAGVSPQSITLGTPIAITAGNVYFVAAWNSDTSNAWPAVIDPTITSPSGTGGIGLVGTYAAPDATLPATLSYENDGEFYWNLDGTLAGGSDTDPDQFTFTDQTDVAVSTLTTSNTETITGIDAAAAISVTGGEYSIDGGAFTSASGTINNNQTVAVRGTSSASNSTTTDVVLTIGTITDTFSMTTVAAGPIFNDVTYDGSVVDYATTESFKELIEADHSDILVNGDQVHWRITSGPTGGSTVGTDTVPDFEAGVLAGEYEYTHNSVRSPTYTWQIDDFVDPTVITPGQTFVLGEVTPNTVRARVPTDVGVPEGGSLAQSLDTTGPAATSFSIDNANFTVDSAGDIRKASSAALTPGTYTVNITPDTGSPEAVDIIIIPAPVYTGQTAVTLNLSDIQDGGATIPLPVNNETSTVPEGSTLYTTLTFDDPNYLTFDYGQLGPHQTAQVLTRSIRIFNGVTPLLNFVIQSIEITIVDDLAPSAVVEINGINYTDGQTVDLTAADPFTVNETNSINDSSDILTGVSDPLTFIEASNTVQAGVPGSYEYSASITDSAGNSSLVTLAVYVGAIVGALTASEIAAQTTTIADIFNEGSLNANAAESVLSANTTIVLNGVIEEAGSNDSLSGSAESSIIADVSLLGQNDIPFISSGVTGVVNIATGDDLSTIKPVYFATINFSPVDDSALLGAGLSVQGSVNSQSANDNLITSVSSAIVASIASVGGNDNVSADGFLSCDGDVSSDEQTDLINSIGSAAFHGALNSLGGADYSSASGDAGIILQPTTVSTQRYFYTGKKMRLEASKYAASDEPFLFDWSHIDELVDPAISIDVSEWQVLQGSVSLGSDYVDGRNCIVNVSGGLRGEVAVLQNTITNDSFGYTDSTELHILIK